MRIRELRKARRITQLKMALDLDMSQNTISRYESGEREPGIAELIRIADYFRVSIDYLVGRTDDPVMHLYKKGGLRRSPPFSMSFYRWYSNSRSYMLTMSPS